MEIIAFSPDGWGFVKTPDRFVLLRPPYKETKEVKELTVASGIAKHGYFPCRIPVKDQADAVRVLKDIYLRCAKARGIRPLTHEEVVEMVKSAPIDIIERWVGRMEEELIPKEKHDPAQKSTRIDEMLGLLVDLDQVKANPHVHKRILKLTEIVYSGYEGRTNDREV